MSVTWTDGVTPLNKANMDQLEQLARKGAANGYASLDGNGIVPLAQLPIPAVVNGQWLKGSGGAMVWSAITAADVPGLSLTGTYAARPAANTLAAGSIYYATDTMGTFRSDGTNWTLIQQGIMPINAADLGNPPFSTPYDGMCVRYAVDTTAGVFWAFRYRAASASPYKWEFLGGPPQKTILAGFNALTASGAYVNYGFGIVCARAGDYLFHYTGSLYLVSGTPASVYVNASKGSGSIVAAADVGMQLLPTTGSSSIAAVAMNSVVPSVTAGQAVYEIILIGSGGNYQMGNRALELAPVRIS